MSMASTAAERVRRRSYKRQDARGTLVEVINEGAWRSVLTGEMNAGAVLGNHYHKVTEVYFYLVRGTAIVRTLRLADGRREEFTLAAGQGVHLPVMETHAIGFAEPSAFIMLKSQPYDSDDSDTYAYPVDPQE